MLNTRVSADSRFDAFNFMSLDSIGSWSFVVAVLARSADVGKPSRQVIKFVQHLEPHDVALEPVLGLGLVQPFEFGDEVVPVDLADE